MVDREEKRKWKQDKKIAFDVDMTLITIEDTPKYDNIHLLMWYVDRGYDVIIWSGGGLDYAERWAEKLGLAESVRVIEKGSEEVDIAYDDEAVKLGKVNIEV